MNPKIVGYGICGKNEPYLEATLKEFKRLCDETIILLNNPTIKERNLVKKYGFHSIDDDREWGRLQWKIKEDFVTNHVSKLKPDMCVCLDMDEVFDSHLTKEKLYELYKSPFEAFHFRIINLWDDGYEPNRSFWNIRAWKWIPEFGTAWPKKNLHCGLGPEWTWGRAFYAPHLLIHYGLKDKERRELKAQRYDKYDPSAKWLSMSPEYYESLRRSPQVLPFDEDSLYQEVVQYVQDINQKYIKPMNKKEDLIYIKGPSGDTFLVPKEKLSDYLNRPGHEVVEEHNVLEDTLDEILDEEPVETVADFEKPQLNPEPSIEFKCDKCDYLGTSARSLMGHKMGKHVRAEQRREAKQKQSWPWKK